MFTKEDYQNYFNGLEKILTGTIEIYTDLLNVLSDKATRNKMNALASENMECYKFIKATKQKFI